MYICLNDLVKILDLEIISDTIKNTTSYISPSLYFTVNDSDGIVSVHGNKTDISVKSVDNIKYIRLEDLQKIIPVTVSYKDGRLDITTASESHV